MSFIKMGTDATRKKKIAWINERLEAAFNKNEKLNKSKFLALFAMQCFSTKKTGIEILNLFEELGKITIEGNEITVHKLAY